MGIQISEIKKPLAVAVLLVVLTASVVSIFLSQCERRPKPDFAPVIGPASVMAEETAKLLQNEGGAVVIVAEAGASPKVQLETFEKNLQRNGKVTVKAVEKLSAEQTKNSLIAGIPGDLFINILEKHPDIGAIVSFKGPPDFKDEDMAKLPQNRPKILVFAPSGMGIKKLLEGNVIQLAIVSRMGGPPPGAAGGPPMPMAGGAQPPPLPPTETKKDPARAQFDAQYQILTPDSDLSQLFEPPAPPPPPAGR